ITAEDSRPSPASGVSLESYKSQTQWNTDRAIYWLIEPRRSSSVTKYSGTNVHPNQINNLYAETMQAFAHWSLYFTDGTWVFTD
ncbi:hypothetical protein PUNSTDRAFT_40300, partial [Punctularia strigosozonata HHB-11173 SS5]|uniref:uncharacterized protein n=1 Tax=Punctularia strigosozonata (strain HHB-11173) TaxID=741275 RepID=UPI0004416CC1